MRGGTDGLFETRTPGIDWGLGALGVGTEGVRSGSEESRCRGRQRYL